MERRCRRHCNQSWTQSTRYGEAGWRRNNLWTRLHTLLNLIFTALTICKSVLNSSFWNPNKHLLLIIQVLTITTKVYGDYKATSTDYLGTLEGAIMAWMACFNQMLYSLGSISLWDAALCYVCCLSVICMVQTRPHISYTSSCLCILNNLLLIHVPAFREDQKARQHS